MQERVVYLVDASPKILQDDEKTATHFQVAINSIAQSLRSQIINRPGIVKAMEEFKLSVYGENYEEEDSKVDGKAEPSKKRKANAMKEYANYDWSDLADNGKLKDLTVVELNYYLGAHNLPVTGSKEALISRIVTHMGK
ncbi:hypothetical protein K7X08_010611 [Anisodus acutangulus]|uniref:SAP domain-containing protein n=1 Tax=Anisodus acutangulus TaxID=402998 RepID=A0A9Q1RB54_9SOLA|nr:hypothetical protein K7X08_010611 [Anisodus acutangulus]